MRLPEISTAPALSSPVTAMPMPLLRITLPVAVTSRQNRPQPIIRPANRRALDGVAGDGRVGLDRDADAARSGLPRPGREVAHEIALYDGEPAAFVEVRDGDAGGGAVDEVAGDHRALERELGIEPDLAHAGGIVGDDLHVGCTVGAHGGERAVGDAVRGHEHAAGAIDVDAVAVLACAAGPGADAVDAVHGDDGAVGTLLRAPYQNAVVGGAVDRIVRDLETFGVEAEQCRLQRAGDAAAGDEAGASCERDAVRRARLDREVAQGDLRAAVQFDEPTRTRIDRAAADQGEAVQSGAVGALAGQQGCAANVLQNRRAGHAGDDAAVTQCEATREIAAGRQMQRDVTLGRLVDCGLQSCRLITAAVGRNAEVERRRARPGRGCLPPLLCGDAAGAEGHAEAHADAEAGSHDETTIEVHCPRQAQAMPGL